MNDAANPHRFSPLPDSQVSHGQARLMEVVFPGDTNHLGSAFGGHILSLMDKVAAFAAWRLSRAEAVVTASIDRVDFKVPIRQGDILELIGQVEGIGHSSMRVRVEVFREDRRTGLQSLATVGHFVMVALDESGLPAPVDLQALERLAR